ncbi:MFS transporter [Leucobacter chromiireducens]|uniref:MFS transporter n=1 Tax=Leucobacter chromiireducens subsp. solipictus TaxID=398235 RepID=A0ABS1SG39_9MICO|nr:MFS transporter [Leucobacter chromiireducens]MBL3679007.1 MFS transporter [Leucobacter chromiireducens subsp. solipictus]
MPPTAPQTAPTPVAAPRPAPRGLVVALATAVLSFSMMQTLLVPALPTFMREFGVDTALAGWILTSYLLCGAVAAPILGSLGDRYGHRRVLVLTFALFVAGGVIAALAPTLPVLLTGRVLQGASTAAFPLALAIVRRHTTGAAQRSAIGWLSGTMGLGAGAALVVGGVIVESLSWHWLFVTGAAMGAVSIALILTAVPASARGAGSRTDWPGTILLTVGLLALLLGISQGGSWGWTSPLILGLFALAVAALLALIAVERRTPVPLIDVRTLARPALAVTNGLTLFLGFIPYLFYIGLPVLLQSPGEPGFGQGFTVTQTGIALLPGAILVFLGGRFAPWLIGRVGPKLSALISLAVMGLGSVGIAVAPSSLPVIVAFFSLVGLGNGIGFAVVAELVANLAPRDEIAAALGVNGVLRTVGSALGAPVATAVLASGAWANAGGPTAASFTVLFVIGAGVSLLGALSSLSLRAQY